MFLFPVILPRAHAQEDGLLLHWRFDEGRGASTRDDSGNGLHGQVSARWRRKAPSGSALSFDGRPEAVVQVVLPEDKRFGTGSWTFSTWLKPRQFSINAELKQRRIFSFGEYPAANLVINIEEDGRPSCFATRTRQNHRHIHQRGALRLNEWAHLALVVDREGHHGVFPERHGQRPGCVPPGFAGDFSRNGILTVGSSWQNYIGEMDR